MRLQAVHIFILSAGDKKQEIPSRLIEFMDWLDELKYERREKFINFHFLFKLLWPLQELSSGHKVSFVLCYTEKLFGWCLYTANNLELLTIFKGIEITKSFEKRLCSLEALPLGQPQLISEDKKGLQEIYAQLNDLLRRYNVSIETIVSNQKSPVWRIWHTGPKWGYLTRGILGRRFEVIYTKSFLINLFSAINPFNGTK